MQASIRSRQIRVPSGGTSFASSTGHMSQQPIYTIVGAVDMSDATEMVLERLLDVAQRYIPCEIHVIRVLEGRQEADDLESEEQQLRRQIEDVASLFSPQKLNGKIGVHVRKGDPISEISDLIDETRADLVIVGHHGWGGRTRRRSGSVSKKLSESARCSVLVAQVPDFETRSAPACVACGDIRRESEGNIWFCPAHTDHEKGRRWYGVLSRGISIHPGVGLF